MMVEIILKDNVRELEKRLKEAKKTLVLHQYLMFLQKSESMSYRVSRDGNFEYLYRHEDLTQHEIDLIKCIEKTGQLGCYYYEAVLKDGHITTGKTYHRNKEEAEKYISSILDIKEFMCFIDD